MNLLATMCFASATLLPDASKVVMLMGNARLMSHQLPRCAGLGIGKRAR